MKFPSIKSLAQTILQAVQRFPLEILFALFGTIAAIANIKHHAYRDIYSVRCLRMIMTANFGLLLSLSATLFAESRNIMGYKKTIIKLLAALAAGLMFLLINPFIREYDTIR